MYKLYYRPGACSLAIHAALIEIGAPFELENVRTPVGQPYPEHFMKINPRGAVPVLQIDNFILREGAAILIYLLDTHKNALLPQSQLARAEALEWLAFANATMHPAYSRMFFLHRLLGENVAQSPLYIAVIEQIQKYWNEIEDRLTANKYLCGKECTIADILVAVIANWSDMAKISINFGAKTTEFFKQVVARPAFQKALASEGVVYKF